MENQNTKLRNRQQKHQHDKLEKIVNINVLQVTKYYLPNKEG